jgi:GT2 family glycosyltransferase
MRVAMLILNWNGYEVTKECLLSLRKVTCRDFRIILIDNGSNDHSVEKLKQDFTGDNIDFLPLDKNYGFTGGNNRGLEYAKQNYDPDYYLMLNNDTIADPLFLDKMLEQFALDEQCFAVVPKIYFYDRPTVFWFAGGSISRITGVVKHFGAYQKDTGQFDESGRTGFMNGCCALISKASAKELGFMDDRFFANSEDADYSLRILDSGHTIRYAHEAVIYHKVSHSFKSNRGKWLGFYLATRNLIQMQRKHLPVWKMPFFLLAFSVRWVAYLTVKLTLLRDFKSIRAVFVGIADGFSNRLRYVN